MEILKLVQKNLLLFGVGLNQRPFNARNLVTICIICVAIASALTYFFCGAKTFQQYTDSVLIVDFGSYIHCLWHHRDAANLSVYNNRKETHK